MNRRLTQALGLPQAPVFDRRPSNEVGQARYPITARLAELGAVTATAPTRHWQVGPASDQNTFACRICGQFGACTGYGMANFLRARSWMLRRLLGNHDAHAGYHEAQHWDEWEGGFESYEGSSANGIALAMRDRGLIGEFRWTRDPDELARALAANRAGVCVASDWHAGMMATDPEGYLHDRGGIEGGHFYHVPGWDGDRRCFEVNQSWGSQWGIRLATYRRPAGERGFARIDRDTMGRLLAADGEGLIVTQVHVS